MVAKNNQFATALQEQGYSLTKPRQAVFAVLESNGPLSMHELIGQLRAVDRATVYRTVDLLEQLGIIKRIQIGWKYKVELSDAFSYHHHHLSCTKCGQIISLPEDSSIEQAIHALGTEHGFTITDHQLEIQGICKDCKTQ